MKYKNLTNGQIGALEVVLPFRHYFEIAGIELKKLIDFTADALKLETGETTMLQEIFADKEIGHLCTAKDCSGYLRYIEFSRFSGMYIEDEDRSGAVRVFNEILERISIASCEHSRLSPKSIAEQLQKECSLGGVFALRMMSLMYLFGITVEKNVSKARNYLKSSADWNDIPSILLLIHCYQKSGNKERAYIWKKIFLEITEPKGIYEYSRKAISGSMNVYTADDDTNKRAGTLAKKHALLKEAQSVNQKNFNELRCNFDAIKVVYSDKISLIEAKRLLDTPDNVAWKDISNLFLDVKGGALKEVEFPLAGRQSEERIIRNYFLERINGKSVKPLLFVINDEYIKKCFINYVCKLVAELTYKMIDARCISEERLRKSNHRNNIIASTMTSRGRADFVLLIDNLEASGFESVRHYADLLRAKSKYYIDSLGITLNISKLILVAFCKDLSKLHSELKPLCDVLEIKPLTLEEKKSAFKLKTDELLGKDADESVRNEIASALSRVGKPEDADAILTKALRESDSKNGSYQGLLELLDKHIRASAPIQLGFGTDD